MINIVNIIVYFKVVILRILNVPLTTLRHNALNFGTIYSLLNENGQQNVITITGKFDEKPFHNINVLTVC